MQTRLLDSLASHIVAWHNRHPLARRIGAQHVQSPGYVMLPFAAAADAASDMNATVRSSTDQPAAADSPAGAGATLRERAMARALQASADEPPSPAQPGSTPPPAAPKFKLRPAFTEDFIPPLRPAAVAAFALKHGADEASPGKSAVRMVKPEPGLAPGLMRRRWLLTAQIEIDGRRTRVLAGVGVGPAVLGRRLWSLPRVALAVGLPLLTVWVLAMGVKGLLQPSEAQQASPAASAAAMPSHAASHAASAAPAAPAAPAALAAPVAPAASAASTAPSASSAAPVQTQAVAAAARPVAPAASQAPPNAPEPPKDVDPTWGRVQLPSIGPVADERRRTAAAARQANAASAAAAVVTAPAAASLAQTRTGPSTPAAATAGPVFALSSRVIRTKSESEQIAEALRGLLATGDAPRLQVENMRSGDDWRVVCWPFATRDQADKARALLASRGMKFQVVDF